MDAISTYSLSKQFGNTKALSGVSLQVPAGTAFACVGAQDSGKTVLLRLLSGLCRPSFGECSILGLSPIQEREKVHSLTGTVLGTAGMYKQLTLSENLLFYAGVHGVDSYDAPDRLSFLLHELGIWESRDSKVGGLPTSVLRRASLARALMHSPKVLLVDSPAEGFHQETADSMGELLSRLVYQEGITLLLCTRDMEYAGQLCENFALLKDGALMAKGDPETLRKGAGIRYRAALRLEEGSEPPAGFRRFGGQWKKDIASEEELPRIISQAVSQGSRLYEAWLEKPTLEEIYAAYSAGGIQRAGEADEPDDQNYFDQTELRPAAGNVPPEEAFRPEDRNA